MLVVVPIPGKDISYHVFLNAIGIFLLSYAMILFFWYELHLSFSLVDILDEKLMLTDMVYLGVLCLITIMTKWVIQSTTELSVISLGVVYLVTNFFSYLIFLKTHRLFTQEHNIVDTKKYLKLRKLLGIVVICNIFAIGLAALFPSFALLFYSVLLIFVILIRKGK